VISVSSTDRINAKIDQIERLLAEIREQVKTVSKEGESQPRRVRGGGALPSDEVFRAEYERLYEEFIGRNLMAVEGFIKAKTKVYLQAFCKANNLPVDAAKLRKDKIASEVMQWMAQRKAITK